MVKGKKNANVGFFNYAKSFTYNAAGAVTSLQLGNGRWESTTFNNRLQPTQIALGSTISATDLLKLDYGYGTTDNNGNVQTQTITVPTVGLNTGFAAVQSYSYDSLNRLKDATEAVTPTGGSASQSWKQAFTYDRYGNRNFDEANTTTLLKSCGTSPNFTVCAADRKIVNPSINTSNNRLSTSDNYTFDNSGNTTADANGQIYVYNAENKIVEASNGNGMLGQYSYDGDGKRVKKLVPSTGELTVFVYDAAGKQVAEYSTIVANSTDAKVNYLTSDHLGSPRINTDAKGAIISRHDYHPFGEEIDGTGGRTAGLNYGDDYVRKQFTGYEKDNETDLNFAQARYQNAGVGRFTSPDPLMASSSRTNPQTWNRYAYVLNNPLNYMDPTGMSWGVRDDGHGKTSYCYLPGKDICKGYTKYTGDGILENPFINGNALGYAIRLLPEGGYERVVRVGVSGQPPSWISQKDLIAINAISAGALCSISAGLLCPSSLDEGISHNVKVAGDAVQYVFLAKSLLKAGLSLAAVAAVLKKDPKDVIEIIGKMSLPELNKLVNLQKPQVRALFGQGLKGADEALELVSRGELPSGAEGLTRETLEALKKISTDYLETSRPNVGGELVHKKRLLVVQTMLDNLPK